MPITRAHHRQRARSEQGMADASATNMARIIHTKLADLHSAAADNRADKSVLNEEGR
ncbi:hypothetical protein [Sphingomonas sp.]|jgi:hypothetical protein|uniref:hypothetical protein n=1 Tax=Sphingomonas sp. TaxID=28214 RepID=UPI002D7E7E29|nr:hypothetical protein [Sphingomonas sp.]HEU0045815.1 hypothetical protein [Sphingomonas sp.]